MAAYLIADVDVNDARAFREYLEKVSSTDELYGGRYIGPEGPITVLEGEWSPQQFAVIQFPDMASLLAWYNSPEYAPLKAIRHKCAQTRLIAIDGIAAPSTESHVSEAMACAVPFA